jgi:RND family efflux transporter MFP subunit
VAKLRKSALVRTTSQPGTAEAAATANVYARVSGTVSKPTNSNIETNLNIVEIGEVVKTGQVLAVIEAPELAAEVEENRIQVERANAKTEQSNAAVAAAQGDEARSGERANRAKIAAVEAELKVAHADLRLAQARLARAEAALQSTRVVSPISGVVTQRNANEGDFVRSAAIAGSSPPLFAILRTDVIRMVVHIPDQDVPLLHIGQPAEVRFDALGKIARAKVSRMAVAESTHDRTLRAEIDLPNPDGKVRPGMYGTVTITLQEKPGTLAIPRDAILESKQNGVSLCYRVINNRAVLTQFRSGKSEDPIRHDIEVLDGLKEGEIVIVDPGTGRSLEKTGQPIEPVMQGEEAGTQPRS